MHATTLTKIRLVALAIVLLGVIAGFFATAQFLPIPDTIPGAKFFKRPYRLGLDLQGGTHLLYRADFTGFQGGSPAEAMAGLRDVIERRVNPFGSAETIVQVDTAGSEYRLIVELPGVKDVGEALRMIGKVALLEFKEARSPEETKALLDARAKGEGAALTTDPYFIGTDLTGRVLTQATLQFDSNNLPEIGLEFNDEGGALFEKLTERNIGKPLAIYLDGALLSAPTVREKISGGKAQITGQFSVAEARDLVRLLNSGALPVPITLVSQQSVEATLGAESLARSLRAVLIGFAAVALFMIFWYRLPGMIAVIALAVYASIVLSLFKLIPVTLTAPGIAGFVLSLGMAVDANILIFERMKEELRWGKELPQAISEGFLRAWTSIRDSNVSSFITAAILYWRGTNVVQGFALTLAIGILVSMFSAISVSRTFLLALVTRRLERAKGFFMSGFARGSNIPTV